jgi:hypothetical protein
VATPFVRRNTGFPTWRFPCRGGRFQQIKQSDIAPAGAASLSAIARRATADAVEPCSARFGPSGIPACAYCCARSAYGLLYLVQKEYEKRNRLYKPASGRRLREYIFAYSALALAFAKARREMQGRLRASSGTRAVARGRGQGIFRRARRRNWTPRAVIRARGGPSGSLASAHGYALRCLRAFITWGAARRALHHERPKRIERSGLSRELCSRTHGIFEKGDVV